MSSSWSPVTPPCPSLPYVSISDPEHVPPRTSLLSQGTEYRGLRPCSIRYFLCTTSTLTTPYSVHPRLPRVRSILRSTYSVLRAPLRSTYGVHTYSPVVFIYSTIPPPARALPAPVPDRPNSSPRYCIKRMLHATSIRLFAFIASRSSSFLRPTFFIRHSHNPLQLFLSLQPPLASQASISNCSSIPGIYPSPPPHPPSKPWSSPTEAALPRSRQIFVLASWLPCPRRPTRKNRKRHGRLHRQHLRRRRRLRFRSHRNSTEAERQRQSYALPIRSPPPLGRQAPMGLRWECQRPVGWSQADCR